MARLRFFLEDDSAGLDLAADQAVTFQNGVAEFSVNLPVVGELNGEFDPSTCNATIAGLKVRGVMGNGAPAICWFEVPILRQRIGLEFVPDQGDVVREISNRLLQWVPVGVVGFGLLLILTRIGR